MTPCPRATRRAVSSEAIEVIEDERAGSFGGERDRIAPGARSDFEHAAALDGSLGEEMLDHAPVGGIDGLDVLPSFQKRDQWASVEAPADYSPVASRAASTSGRCAARILACAPSMS